MHEMSLMSGIFDVINSTLNNYPEVDKVTKVKLKVGKFTNAVPAALEFAFQAFSTGTKAEGALLEIETVPVVACCKNCSHEFFVEGLAYCCPKCRSYQIEIISGRELLLESLEVE